MSSLSSAKKSEEPDAFAKFKSYNCENSKSSNCTEGAHKIDIKKVIAGFKLRK